MKPFTAYRIHASDNPEKPVDARHVEMTLDELTEGDVVVEVACSSINYKDALAATGKGRILRKMPLNGGIDLSGRVVSSTSPDFAVGDRVMSCGDGLSEHFDGGYAEFARLPAERLLPVPEGLSLRDAMAIGTAGFTAGIAVQRMQDNGQVPEYGPILVTGATGGVGSFAISMLAGLGYEVVAYTGKTGERDYLHALGAADILDRRQVDFGNRPLESAQWGGAVDNVGGETLGWLTRTVRPWGSIASIGLAGGIELNTTVMPLILRGVSLLGINCIELPAVMKQQVWQRLGTDLKPANLELIAPNDISLAALPEAFERYITGDNVARTVVRVNPDLD